METAEPVPYEFSGHGVGAFGHRRAMDSPLFPFYSHPTSTPYSLPYQNPAPAAYSFGSTALNQPPHPYHRNTLRCSRPSPEIRPAKNAINPASKRDLGLRGSSGASTGAGAQEKKGAEAEFSTEVDVLMKAIQAKPETSPVQQSLPPLQQLAPPGYPAYPMSPPRCLLTNEGQLSRSGKKRKYTCTLPNCGKSFAQKTHLEIHTRAHTGDKPFVCKEPSCGQRFSQLGNLKTHQRRHTGEKPFKCEICHKQFAQRGNVRAHQITHMHNKPFTCLLDDCGKKFTQLGNLKSHQNKFHATTLRNLTLRFAQMGDNGPSSPQDRELWEYFAQLYKNSNKGIKGRGKDRRIATTKRSAATSTSMNPINSMNMMMNRMSSMESDEDPQARRGSYEDTLSMYTGGSSSDGDDPGPYYVDRRGP
ncbi:hypothetical protein N7462_008803 [Penicillium macrosclerotiorum]|uniref:uncharacterized protein n=1 Tax=Penicillium macrosclerotiorum TaxID=303699 RepID=UPI0025494C69|nr:uncharacterized protein N7462_008803 [Penicillium macrosclerotiorum]KAJ5675906.1 hypothetical protein N7462_008803 [Penicillium macrosclerotiorum]